MTVEDIAAPDQEGPQQPRRLFAYSRGHSLARQLGLAFLVSVGLILLTALTLNLVIRSLSGSMSAFMERTEPRMAAAYEMEINAVETGMAVMKYLERPQDDFLTRLQDAEEDFVRYHQRFQELAGSDLERTASDRTIVQYRRYLELGRSLIDLRDRRALGLQRLEVAIHAMRRQLGKLHGLAPADENLQAFVGPLDNLLLETVLQVSRSTPGDIGAFESHKAQLSDYVSLLPRKLASVDIAREWPNLKHQLESTISTMEQLLALAREQSLAVTQFRPIWIMAS